VKTALLLGNVPHDSIIISIVKGETRGEEYKKINKRGLVPIIVDGDF